MKKENIVKNIQNTDSKINTEQSSTEISKNFVAEKLGLSIEEYEKLDVDEVERLIENYRNNNSNNLVNCPRMIGNGEHTVFVKKFIPNLTKKNKH